MRSDGYRPNAVQTRVGRRGSRRIVLVVDHDPLVGLGATQWLRKRGFQCLVARSVSEAREMLDDVRLLGADLDGLLTCGHLRDGAGREVEALFRRAYPLGDSALMSEPERRALADLGAPGVLRGWGASHRLSGLLARMGGTRR